MKTQGTNMAMISTFFALLVVTASAGSALAQSANNQNGLLTTGRSVYDPSRSMNPAVRFNSWSTPAQRQVGVPLQPGDLGYDPKIDGRGNR
jgi:hypothetical protein